jgi:hypothetical protein
LDVDGNLREDLASPSLQAPEPANEDATHLPAGVVNGVRVGGGFSTSGVGLAFVTAVAASAPEGGSMVQAGTKRKRDWESNHANDIIGVVVLEAEGADDLPETRNGTLFCCFGVIFSFMGPSPSENEYRPVIFIVSSWRGRLFFLNHLLSYSFCMGGEGGNKAMPDNGRGWEL